MAGCQLANQRRGHVGRAATVLAARAGAHIIATARATDHDTCRRLGAHVVLG